MQNFIAAFLWDVAREQVGAVDHPCSGEGGYDSSLTDSIGADLMQQAGLMTNLLPNVYSGALYKRNLRQEPVTKADYAATFNSDGMAAPLMPCMLDCATHLEPTPINPSADEARYSLKIELDNTPKYGAKQDRTTTPDVTVTEVLNHLAERSEESDTFCAQGRFGRCNSIPELESTCDSGCFKEMAQPSNFDAPSSSPACVSVLLHRRPTESGMILQETWDLSRTGLTAFPNDMLADIAEQEGWEPIEPEYLSTFEFNEIEDISEPTLDYQGEQEQAELKKNNSVSTSDALGCDVTQPALSLSSLRSLMKQSRETQEKLQEWDKQNGLPRSHCFTMMHTNRSRRQLELGRILPKWNGSPLIADDGEKTKIQPPASKKRKTTDPTSSKKRGPWLQNNRSLP
jgi:hypothetical protein